MRAVVVTDGDFQAVGRAALFGTDHQAIAVTIIDHAGRHPDIGFIDGVADPSQRVVGGIDGDGFNGFARVGDKRAGRAIDRAELKGEGSCPHGGIGAGEGMIGGGGEPLRLGQLLDFDGVLADLRAVAGGGGKQLIIGNGRFQTLKGIGFFKAGQCALQIGQHTFERAESRYLRFELAFPTVKPAGRRAAFGGHQLRSQAFDIDSGTKPGGCNTCHVCAPLDIVCQKTDFCGLGFGVEQ